MNEIQCLQSLWAEAIDFAGWCQCAVDKLETMARLEPTPELVREMCEIQKVALRRFGGLALMNVSLTQEVLGERFNLGGSGTPPGTEP